MARNLRSLTVVGIHRVEPTREMLDVYDFVWGSDSDARQSRDEHFAALYLVEIEVQPREAEIDWASISQPAMDKPESEWQVPWDERPVADEPGRWTFFLHFVDLATPLATPVGQIPLPQPTAVPRRLAGIEYDLPG